MKQGTHERALRLIEKVLQMTELAGDRTLHRRAAQIRNRLKLPMSVVLAKVEGDSVREKCKRLGITRQAYEQWLHGVSRPSLKHARRLAQLTGYDALDIRGRHLSLTAPPPPPPAT